MWRLKILIHDRRECMSRTEVKKARSLLSRREWLIISASFVISLLAGVLTAVHANAVLVFVVAAGALSLLAALVGRATDQIGARLGSGTTGVLQSALPSLSEACAMVPSVLPLERRGR
jgi:Ca2+/H+ antiporter